MYTADAKKTLRVFLKAKGDYTTGIQKKGYNVINIPHTGTKKNLWVFLKAEGCTPPFHEKSGQVTDGYTDVRDKKNHIKFVRTLATNSLQGINMIPDPFY